MNAVDACNLPGGERQFRFVTPSDNGWPLSATADVVAAEPLTPDKADFTSLFAVDAGTGEPQATYRPSRPSSRPRGWRTRSTLVSVAANSARSGHRRDATRTISTGENDDRVSTISIPYGIFSLKYCLSNLYKYYHYYDRVRFRD